MIGSKKSEHSVYSLSWKWLVVRSQNIVFIVCLESDWTFVLCVSWGEGCVCVCMSASMHACMCMCVCVCVCVRHTNTWCTHCIIIFAKELGFKWYLKPHILRNVALYLASNLYITCYVTCYVTCQHGLATFGDGWAPHWLPFLSWPSQTHQLCDSFLFVVSNFEHVYSRPDLVFLCASVCLSVASHISETSEAIAITFDMAVTASWQIWNWYYNCNGCLFFFFYVTLTLKTFIWLNILLLRAYNWRSLQQQVFK